MLVKISFVQKKQIKIGPILILIKKRDIFIPNLTI